MNSSAYRFHVFSSHHFTAIFNLRESAKRNSSAFDLFFLLAFRSNVDFAGLLIRIHMDAYGTYVFELLVRNLNSTSSGFRSYRTVLLYFWNEINFNTSLKTSKNFQKHLQIFSKQLKIPKTRKKLETVSHIFICKLRRSVPQNLDLYIINTVSSRGFRTSDFPTILTECRWICFNVFLLTAVNLFGQFDGRVSKMCTILHLWASQLFTLNLKLL